MVCLLLAGVELKIVVYPTSALIHLLCIPPQPYIAGLPHTQNFYKTNLFSHLSKKVTMLQIPTIWHFFKLILDHFLFRFLRKEISKKSNWNRLPPHPHNFRSTICFPAFQPHRDQAIKCECENLKVFSLLCDEFNTNQFKCQAQISFGARCSFPSYAGFHELYFSWNSCRLQFSFLAVWLCQLYDDFVRDSS